MSELLRFDGLGVRFGDVEAVHDLSLTVAPGETAAIVGESGSGKSVAMLAALGLLPPTAEVRGRVLLEGRDLLALDRPALDRIRGKVVSIIFQEPQSALDPLFPVGAQIAAVLRYGRGLSRGAARARAVALLEEVDIAEPARRARAYPHELSGGQRQRVAIAMAIACEPALIIADEPTTALDVTVAARILALLAELKARRGMALILISHDLGLVRRVADSVHVMEKGRLRRAGEHRLVGDDVEDDATVVEVVGVGRVEHVAGLDVAPDDVGVAGTIAASARQQADPRLVRGVPLVGGSGGRPITAFIDSVTGRSSTIAKRFVIAQSWIDGPCSTLDRRLAHDLAVPADDDVADVLQIFALVGDRVVLAGRRIECGCAVNEPASVPSKRIVALLVERVESSTG